MSVNAVATTQQITQFQPHRQGGRLHETGSPGRMPSATPALANEPTPSGVPFQKLANHLQSTILQLQSAGVAGPVSQTDASALATAPEAPTTIKGNLLQALRSYVVGKPAPSGGIVGLSA